MVCIDCFKGGKMERIIENEIYRLIKREPTSDELESALKYLDYCADDLVYSENIPELMKDWLCEEMEQCEYCGAWSLRSEMTYDMDVCGYFCDGSCEEAARMERQEDIKEEMYELTHRG